MATKLETAIIEMKSDLEHIKLTTDEIKSAVFGNGKSGLKARVTGVEVTLSGVVLIGGVVLVCVIRAYFGG